MKGLFIKDFAYLKQNKLLYLFLLVFGLGGSLFYDNSSFILGYFSVFPGILILGTLNYDDYNHGLSFLLTLPPSRKDYVKEKYILAYCIGLVLIFFASILSIFADYRLQHSLHFINMDWIIGVLSILMFSFLLIALLLPIQIKVGSQKSQFAMIIVFGGIFLLGIITYFISQLIGIDIESIFNQLFSIPSYAFLFIFVFIIGIINYISYKISVTFLEKKEF